MRDGRHRNSGLPGRLDEAWDVSPQGPSAPDQFAERHRAPPPAGEWISLEAGRPNCKLLTSPAEIGSPALGVCAVTTPEPVTRGTKPAASRARSASRAV